MRGSSFKLALNHSFSLIRDGENYFSAERFIFKDRRTAESLAMRLKSRSTNTLQIESFTRYDFLLVENNLVFFIAENESYLNNRALFEDIKNNFLAEYRANYPNSAGVMFMDSPLSCRDGEFRRQQRRSL